MSTISPLKKKYPFNWGMRAVCILFILLAIALLRFDIMHSDARSWYRMILSVLAFLMFGMGFFIRYEITEAGPKITLGPYNRRVPWEAIKMVYDDNFSSAHFYILKLHDQKWKVFGFQNGVKNYKDFLREAIMRVQPDTEVEDKILQLVGFTKTDIGKLYSPTITTGDARTTRTKGG